MDGPILNSLKSLQLEGPSVGCKSDGRIGVRAHCRAPKARRLSTSISGVESITNTSHYPAHDSRQVPHGLPDGPVAIGRMFIDGLSRVHESASAITGSTSHSRLKSNPAHWKPLAQPAEYNRQYDYNRRSKNTGYANR